MSLIEEAEQVSAAAPKQLRLLFVACLPNFPQVSASKQKPRQQLAGHQMILRTPLISTAGPNRPDPTRLPHLAQETNTLAPPRSALPDPHLQEAADGTAWLRRHLQARQ